MSVFLFGISSFWGWSPRLSYTGIEVQQPNAFFLTTLINMPNQNKSIHPSMFLLFLLKTAVCLWATSDFSPFRCNPLSLRANIPSPTLSLFFFPSPSSSSPLLVFLFPSLCPCGKINLLSAENLALVFYVIQVLSTGNDYVILHSLFYLCWCTLFYFTLLV